MQINCLVGIAISANPVGTSWNNNEKIKFTGISFRAEPDFTGRVLKQNYTDGDSVNTLLDEKGPINLILSRDRWDKDPESGISTTASLEVFSYVDAPESIRSSIPFSGSVDEIYFNPDNVDSSEEVGISTDTNSEESGESEESETYLHKPDPSLVKDYLKHASDNQYVFAYYYNVGVGWSCFRTYPAPENYDYSGRVVTIPDGDYTSLIDMPRPPRYEDLPEV
jgi:hypothetical protein